jgi:D-3-phosphoglycerate dehydrogenase
MRRLAGQTIGIAGFGRIGQALAQRTLGMGLNVVVFDKFPYQGELPVEQVSFPELLDRSDLISIHLPLTEETRHLFNSDAFARMKPTAFLVNTARGAIVDRTALHAALEAGQLAGAGLDVQEVEPPDLTESVYQSERLIVTPHAAFTSLESLADLRRTTAQQVCDCLAGRRPDHVVNPQVFS